MANTTLNILPLDFPSIKAALITYLSSQTIYQDYNFAGSDWNVLIDLLSYNTFHNFFYGNMLGSEMFLDSAQLRDSIVSHAKELNYLPRSNISAELNINLTITTTGANFVTIAPYTPFTGRIGSNTYQFSTNSTIVAISTNTTINVPNVTLYEGVVLNETFVVDYSNAVQRFVLSNPGIDTSSLSVFVIEDSGSSNLEYLQTASLFDLNANSQVYFVQASSNNRYELIFGDNVVGRKPADGALVSATYRISSGSLPNGLGVITPNGLVGGYSNVVIQLNGPAGGGANVETTDSIQFNAPRAFATQERAVTDSDYETLLLTHFPEIRAVAAYGGDELSPPQYGKVFISVEITGVDGIPTSKADQYVDFLRGRCTTTFIPTIQSPDFLYVDVVSTVRYNINQTQNDVQTIKTEVANAISTYSSTNLNEFKTTLYYSKLLAAIDAADISIIGNETTLRLIKLANTVAGVPQNFAINFNQALDSTLPPLAVVHPTTERHTVISNIFLVNNKSCVLEDDGNGTINLSEVTLTDHKVITSVGTLDYDTGMLSINNVTPQTGQPLTFYAVSEEADLTGQQNVILLIRPQDVNITVIPIQA